MRVGVGAEEGRDAVLQLGPDWLGARLPKEIESLTRFAAKQRSTGQTEECEEQADCGGQFRSRREITLDVPWDRRSF